MVNDYKPDEGKPPVLDAVLIPYRRALLAIAAMKLDMAAKHKLLGAVNPFLEWKQLPNAKARLANAGARHVLEPWTVNTKDGTHLHLTHAIVDLLMALELHLEEAELDARAGEELGVGVPDYSDSPEQTASRVCAPEDLAGRARIELALACSAWREKPLPCRDAECVRERGHRGSHKAINGLYWTSGESL